MRSFWLWVSWCVMGSGCESLRGPEGPAGGAGPQGEQGVQGEQGPEGPEGPQGEQGLQGEQGVQGEQGPQGLQGEQGPQGDDGQQGPKGDKGKQGDPGLVDPNLCHLVRNQPGGAEAIAECDPATEYVLYGGCYGGTSGLSEILWNGPEQDDIADTDVAPAIPNAWQCLANSGGALAYAMCCPLP